MADLSKKYKNALSTVLAQSGENRTIALNPADMKHKAVIDMFMDMSNKNEHRYPGMHRGLAGAARNSGEISPHLDDLTVIDQGRCKGDGKRAVAQAWHASRGGAMISGVATLMMDAETLNALAFGTGTQVSGTLAKGPTSPPHAKSAPDKTTTVAFSYAQNPGQPPRFALRSQSRFLAANQIPITVEIPTNTPIKPGLIQIGLGRTGDSPDVDYFYTEPSTLNYPNLLMPFKGNATLPYNIANVDATGHITSGLTLTTKIFILNSAAVAVPIPGMDLNTPVTVIDGNQLKWEYPFDGLPQAQTKSIQYGCVGAANDNLSYFFYEFTVPVINPVAPVYSFTVCSTGTPNNPCSLQCFNICALEYWWHCVAAGSLVTLHDANPIAIEKVTNAMRVRTGIAGGDLGVEATTLTPHDPSIAPEHPIFGVRRLITTSGASLIVSAGHPIMTPSGPMKAVDLHEGMAVMTVNGPERVMSCNPDSYRGLFVNLKLGNADDRARGFSAHGATFVANGIIVGDHGAMKEHHSKTTRDLSYMIGRLPKEFHKDYESALQDIADAK